MFGKASSTSSTISGLDLFDFWPILFRKNSFGSDWIFTLLFASLHYICSERIPNPEQRRFKMWKVSLSRNSSSPPHLSLKKVSLKSRNSGPTNSTPWMNNHIHSSPTWWSVDLLGAMQDQHSTYCAIPSGNTICTIWQIQFALSNKYTLHYPTNTICTIIWISCTAVT